MFTGAQVIALFTTYRYALIFPIAFVEGPIISIICGWLVAVGVLNLFVVYVLLIVANLTGDVLYYFLGYWGGPPLIRRFGKWLKIDLGQVEKMKNYFDQHGGKIIVTGKVTPHFAAAAMLAGAGLARYRFALFLYYCVVTELIKCIILLAIGYYLGYAYKQITVYLDYVGASISIATVVLIVMVVYHLRRKKKQK